MRNRKQNIERDMRLSFLKYAISIPKVYLMNELLTCLRWFWLYHTDTPTHTQNRSQSTNSRHWNAELCTGHKDDIDWVDVEFVPA